MDRDGYPLLYSLLVLFRHTGRIPDEILDETATQRIQETGQALRHDTKDLRQCGRARPAHFPDIVRIRSLQFRQRLRREGTGGPRRVAVEDKPGTGGPVLQQAQYP